MTAILEHVAPVFLVRDLVASVKYWQDQVGFTVDQLYNEPPTFAMPRRDGVVIMLAQIGAGAEPPLPNWKAQSATNDAYIWVSDADALYAELKDRGVNIDYTIYDTPWGTREFGIQDLDDHDITFGQVLR